MAHKRAVALAAKEGEYSVLEDLIRNGHDYSGKDSREFTPLHEAAKAGHLECVKLILKYARTDLQNNDEFLSCVRFLDGGFDTPLSIAASNGRWSVVEHLAEFYVGATALETGYALMKACENDHTKCVEVLLQNFSHHGDESWDWGEVRPDEESFKDQYFPIHITVSNKNIEATKLLLQFGVDVNCITPKCIKTPLHAAAFSHYAEMIKILLEHGADPTAKDHCMQTSLHNVYVNSAAHSSESECNSSYSESIQLILQAIRKRTGEISLAHHVLQVSKDKSTPLSLAVNFGDTDGVSVLLDEALAINLWSDEKAISNYGTDTEFLLHTACKSNCIDLIDLLLKKLPQLINKPDREGDFPIHVATRYCSREVLELLVQAGADINVKSKLLDRTVLHEACLNNRCDVIPYIFNVFQEDISCVCKAGLTALQTAAVCCNHGAIKSLLAHGAVLVTIPWQCGYNALLMSVAHIENIKPMREEELNYHGPRAILHSALWIIFSDSKSRCLEYLLKNGIPTISSCVSSESHLPTDERLEYSFFPWNLLLHVHSGSVFNIPTFFAKENYITSTIKILLEYGTPFGDWVKARGEVDAEDVFGSRHTSQHPYIHYYLLEMFLNYGMAELQYDCQNFPAIDDLSESLDKLRDRYIERDDGGHYLANSLRRMQLYMKYFPFAKFSNAEERLVPGQKFLNGSIVQSIPTLVEICRWNIRCCIVRKHGAVCMKHVKTLPLPKALKTFLAHQTIE